MRKILSAFSAMLFPFMSVVFSSALLLFACPCSSAGEKPRKERPQWTEKQAWEWDRKVGVIKGFNQPEPAFPGMEMEQIFSRMSELGFNSVRSWVGGKTPQEQVEKIRWMAGLAEKYGMTLQPVLSLHRQYIRRDAPEEQNLADAEECVRTIVRPFKDDPRIIMWDIWNEPALYPRDSAIVMHEMDWLEKEVHWCREERLSQPITSSIIWDSDIKWDNESACFRRRMEVEKMMDIHNFHDYMCADDFGACARNEIAWIKALSDRPIVCTECLTRINGSGVGRSLAEFAANHVHFYIWGTYANDANWQVKWGESTYDPYEPMFHNIMYSDGDLIDSREIEYVRNFKFTDSPSEADPGLEITERWTHERAWERMCIGPVKGQNDVSVPDAGYNSISLKLEYSDFKADRDAFFAALDSRMEKAEEGGYTLLLTLLSDKDATEDPLPLGEYVGAVTSHCYSSPAIEAYDLYWHPGESFSDAGKVSEIVTSAFRYARNSYTNQPLTATPAVRVKPFDADFDYWDALVHGHRNGWNHLEFQGCSSPELVARIWSLSDVVSFSTDQPQAEAGWLLSICYRYGRPIFCTRMASPSEEEASKTLERFSMSHVFWYAASPVDAAEVSSFAFRPIATRRVGD